MCSRSGTEIVTRDLAGAMIRKGHDVAVYSPVTEGFADEVRGEGIPIFESLEDAPFVPDVIHGHHHRELMSALLRFPGAPGLFVCHDPRAWHDAPPVFSRIYQYVAVGGDTRTRLLESGIDEERIHTIPNAVDLNRFDRREEPPGKLSKALLFSHYANDSAEISVVRNVCENAGITLEVAGAACGNVIVPDKYLKNYDLVFGTARCALESLVCGCAVILLNSTNSGPLVTRENWRDLYRQNFSHSAVQEPLQEEVIRDQIQRFDTTDIAGLTSEVSAEVDILVAAGKYEEIYDAVREGHTPSDPEAELKSVSAYLEDYFSYPWITNARFLEQDVAAWKASAEAAHRGWAQLGEEYERLAKEAEGLRKGAG